jgi:hypothetical protein
MDDIKKEKYLMATVSIGSVVIALVCMLSASTITQKEISVGEVYCEERGGVFSIETYGDFVAKNYTCRNGDSASSNTAIKSYKSKEGK